MPKKSIYFIHPGDWIAVIHEALGNLGCRAKLSEIQSEVANLVIDSGSPLPRDYKRVIRRVMDASSEFLQVEHHIYICTKNRADTP